MITGKQRSYLKSLSQKISPAVYIGKADLTDGIINLIDDHLNANELIKCQIQEGSDLDPKETCNRIADELGAEFVQAIGHRFVLYRAARDPQKRSIQLPR